MDIQTAREELISKVSREVSQYEQGQYWITDKVAFNMREMLKTFRKNYWGVYDDPVDPVTKKEKMWVPLTRLLVDSVRKLVDIDPKDVRFRSSSGKYSYMTHLVRGYMRRWMSRNYFNHDINQLIFNISVDGTAVWKTYQVNGKIKYRPVDLLNVYIDPTADSIQDAYRFTERLLMTKTEMQSMDWENTDDFKVMKDLEKNGDDSAVKKVGEFGDVYECWGQFKRKHILAAMGMEHSDDDEEYVEAQVVISGLDTGHTLFHYAMVNKLKDNNGESVRPYEEAWYVKVPGRWYGIGIPETVLQLQWWVNQTINLRINKNTVSQLGLLKVRRGAKVTQQMLQNLVSKGVITLADPERDLQNMEVAEAGPGSYNDEQTAKTWAQEVTSVFDINLADLPASTSATGAAIQDKQARSAFTLVVEAVEHFLQRWIDRQVLPKVPAQIKKEGMVTFFRDFDDVREVRERVAAKLILEELDKRKAIGKVPTEEELQVEMQRVMNKLERRGDLLFENIKEIIVTGMDTEVFVTNAEIDIGVTVRNLLELRNGVDPQSANEMTAEALDLLGLKVPQSLRSPVQAPQQPGAGPELALPGGSPEVNATGVVAEANAMTNEQR